MAGYGYSYVTDKGFIAFEVDLSEGAWKDIAIAEQNLGNPLVQSNLIDLPLGQVWKLRAQWSIGQLVGALDVGTLAKLDAEWDSAQRALAMSLGAAAEHQEAGHREAAGRLQVALLKDGGTGQTLLAYDQEVDFGRNQVKLAGQGQHAADIERIGLGAHLKRIDTATEALATGLGRMPGHNRTPARSRRVRDALTGCSNTFNAIHDELDWAIEHTAQGPARDRLEQLRAPLQALLERYPAVESADGAAGQSGDGPATPGSSSSTPSS